MVHPRTLWTGLAGLLLLLGLIALALTFPGAGIDAAAAWAVLRGSGEGLAPTVVLEWRLPRVLAAVVVGAALAVSGALFQNVTRNPLGSPDIIGFNTGAYTGVILVMLAGFSGFAAVASGAFLGGLATAAVVLLFSLRRQVSGLRLILVGIGVSMMLSSFNRWLILRGDMETALSAASWGAGTLNGLRWAEVAPACLILALLTLAALGFSRSVDLLRLGDDTAVSLGARLNRDRAIMVILGAVLTAVATALAGPISFVALAAPHIAARVSRSPRVPLLLTALIGAVLLVLSDVLAQRLFHPTQLPVGLVTVTVGGLYLLWLMADANRITWRTQS
ncbi:FecCD family ABC transporter permease [Corynebacterium sp. A21]|uniref:FecCD family ABC transporter permease n=1 Tax=Corynebacterium sp. A21 TaxID=3457318 RepID=UPI003FD2C5AD